MKESLPAEQGFAYQCWNCNKQSPAATSDREAWSRARAEGWGMGLTQDGQAHYSCDGCSPCLFNFYKLGDYI